MLRTLVTSLALALGLVALTASAAEPAAAPLPSREERLDRLARLWGQVRYRHPYLAYKDIDWDSALVRAIPQVEAAKDRAAYAAAVQDMLDALKDPATRVLRPDEQKEAAQKAPTLREPRSWEGKDVLVLDLRTGQNPAGLGADLGRAKAVIVDLRARGVEQRTTWAMSRVLGDVLPFLLTQELDVPGERSVYQSGYRPQSMPSSGGYSMSFLTTAGERISPKGEGKARPVVFLLDDKSSVDPRVLTLKAAGLAQLVSEGRLDDGAVVGTTQVELGAGLTAAVRLSELGMPLRVDAVLPRRARAEGKDETLQKALELVKKPAKKGKAREAAELPPARWQPDEKYADMLYPKREYRLLALFRMWNVIHFFYPYKHLLDRDWDGALSAFLPKFEKAKDAAEYALAVAEMSTLVQDGHTFVRGHPELEKRGLAGVAAPFEVMEIDGRPVVVGVRDAEAAPGVAPGQVVETIDGTPLAQRLEELKPYVTASHPAHLRYKLMSRALSGPEGSQATVGVRDASGQLKQVRFTRSVKSFQKPSKGEAWRLLPDNTGYVDLTRLQTSEVAGMFEKLKNTKAIVFDMRGYPNGTAWAIAPYLNTRKARYGAVFERNVLSAVSEEEANVRYKFFQEMPRADVPLYRGKTVMLIDERAISQSEHSGLFFEAANGTTFIGSPSAGANGDVTNLVLPGGISMTFTGHDVRHLDGRQLQRVGLRPQVFVRPTLGGLQSGRDEVLDKALEFLRGGNNAPAVAGDSFR